MDPQKKQMRKLKRDVKRAGNKRRRQYLKRQLHDNPEDAPHAAYDFGRNTSETLNGLDQDATRQREPGE
jgi:hypothetical protein